MQDGGLQPRVQRRTHAKMGSCKLSFYRELMQAFNRIEMEVRQASLQYVSKRSIPRMAQRKPKELFGRDAPPRKRRRNICQTVSRLLDKKEHELFEEFWAEIRLPLIAAIYQTRQLLPARRKPAPYFETAQPLRPIAMHARIDRRSKSRGDGSIVKNHAPISPTRPPALGFIPPLEGTPSSKRSRIWPRRFIRREVSAIAARMRSKRQLPSVLCSNWSPDGKLSAAAETPGESIDPCRRGAHQ